MAQAPLARRCMPRYDCGTAFWKNIPMDGMADACLGMIVAQNIPMDGMADACLLRALKLSRDSVQEPWYDCGTAF